MLGVCSHCQSVHQLDSNLTLVAHKLPNHTKDCVGGGDEPEVLVAENAVDRGVKRQLVEFNRLFEKEYAELGDRWDGLA